jgi:hypothetical protein
MTVIFVDTNVLLHAKPLQDIRWEDLEQGPITIVIVPTVVRELDWHKDQNPKKHLRERARRALQRIEAVLEAPILRPGVSLRLEHRSPNAEWTAWELDASKPDDALVGAVAAYRAAHGDEDVVLVTHDVGPRLTARRLGIRARELPDTEKLPPSKDETEQENERLRKELHELRAAAPKLVVTIDGVDGVVRVSTLAAPPTTLSPEQLRAEVAAARDALPAYTDTPSAGHQPDVVSVDGRGLPVLDLDAIVGSADLNAIPPGEFSRYERARESYLAEYREYLLRTHDVDTILARTVPLDLAILNEGGVPADDIHVEIEVPDHVVLAELPPQAPATPPAPAPPRSQWDEIRRGFLTGIPGLDGYLPPPFPAIPQQVSGPDLEESTARWWVRSLKHGFERPLGILYVTCGPELQPFEVTYSIHAANAVKPFVGKLVVKARHPQDQ